MGTFAKRKDQLAVWMGKNRSVKNGEAMRLAVYGMLVAGMVTVQSCMAATPSFSSYPATQGANKRVRSIDWSSDPDAKRFKIVLTDAFKKGARFAGHYAVATWGCGSDCKAIAVIDMQTGKVTFGPTAEFDFEYHLNSRLLIGNSPSAVQESIREFSGCPGKENYWAITSHYYEWVGTRFRVIADIPYRDCALSSGPAGPSSPRRSD